MERPELSRRKFLQLMGASALATGLGAEVIRKLGASEGPEGQESVPEEKDLYVPAERNEFFDGNPEYLQTMTHADGEWTKEQRKARRKTLRNGENIFQDVGLTFYLVRKGDTISEIRQRLRAYPEYAYLKDQTTKLDSFNIPAKKLRADLWIPIPMEDKDRELSEAQFVAYAREAIDEMRDHEAYGVEVSRILQRVNERDLVATMIAIAKQEGGGLPLGQFDLHRWEPHQSAFSFSYFHVLMKGPGLRARRKLNFTEGQLYHPKNAVKLFLAFIIEKSVETDKRADRFFPIAEHEEAFARFYNGKKWKKTNPHYLENIRRYYTEADQQLSEDGRRWRKDAEPKSSVIHEVK